MRKLFLHLIIGINLISGVFASNSSLLSVEDSRAARIESLYNGVMGLSKQLNETPSSVGVRAILSILALTEFWQLSENGDIISAVITLVTEGCDQRMDQLKNGPWKIASMAPDSTVRGETFSFFDLNWLRVLYSVLPSNAINAEERRILSVGCGTGRNEAFWCAGIDIMDMAAYLLKMQERPPLEMVGFDPLLSEKDAEYYSSENLSLIKGTVDSILRDSRFDVVAVKDALYFLSPKEIERLCDHKWTSLVGSLVVNLCIIDPTSFEIVKAMPLDLRRTAIASVFDTLGSALLAPLKHGWQIDKVWIGTRVLTAGKKPITQEHLIKFVCDELTNGKNSSVESSHGVAPIVVYKKDLNSNSVAPATPE